MTDPVNADEKNKICLKYRMAREPQTIKLLAYSVLPKKHKDHQT